MKVFLLLLLSFTLLFSQNNFVKHLKDEDRASTYLENLIFDGEFDKAEEFAEIANDKFANSADLLCWTGKVYFEKKDLKTAKSYLLQALDVNPTHEMAKLQRELIDEQEAAQTNEDVKNLLELLGDKGLDFLLIFLGFLGAEVIAKRYISCQNSTVFTKANHYIDRKLLARSLFQRLLSSLRHIKPRKLTIICPLINILILITITFAILIPLLFVEFYYETSFLTDEPFITMSAEYIEVHFWYLFGWLTLFTFFAFNLINSLALTSDMRHYEIKLVEELDQLLGNGAYSEIYEVFNYLQEKNVTKKDLETLLQRHSTDPEALLNFFYEIKADDSTYY